MIKKFCLTCGNEFKVLPRRKDSAKFCSRKCKHAQGRTNKECLFCGRPFVTTKWKDSDYCSRRCVFELKKRRAIKICRICGKEYEVQQYYQNNSKYCSIPCRNKGFSKTFKGRFKGEKNPSYKGGRLVKVCKYCGKKFEVHQYRNNTANHCSISCSKLDTSKETRKKIAESIIKLQKENPKIHPNYILAQKGHVTQIERLVRKELIRRNIKFKNQFRVLRYWIDFAFPDIRLAVECDGERWHSTKEQKLKDAKRDGKLASLGWKVKRFKEKEILNNPRRVVDIIEKMIKARGKEVP